MNVNTKAMVGVPVVTRAGTSVGKVASFDLDTQSGRLATLHVKTRGLVRGLMDDELLISWEAIVEMTPEQVVVTERVVKAPVEALAKAGPAISSPSMMKEG